jgi:hypothetical protein
MLARVVVIVTCSAACGNEGSLDGAPAPQYSGMAEVCRHLAWWMSGTSPAHAGGRGFPLTASRSANIVWLGQYQRRHGQSIEGELAGATTLSVICQIAPNSLIWSRASPVVNPNRNSTPQFMFCGGETILLGRGCSPACSNDQHFWTKLQDRTP